MVPASERKWAWLHEEEKGGLWGPESTEPGRERNDQVGDGQGHTFSGPCRPWEGFVFVLSAMRLLEGVKHMNAMLSFKF